MATSVCQPSPGRRLVLMLRELHCQGYARLRLVPSMAPSGVYWRGCITHVGNVLKSNGAIAFDNMKLAMYTTGQGDHHFGWDDAVNDTPDELATKFIERFPDIIELGRGDDSDYVRWYAEMVEATEPEGLVYAYSDWDDSSTEFLNVIGASRDDTVPYPPPGESS